MEPDVIRLYSSSPPPMEDGAEEEDEFGDFDTFSNVPHSISFTEFETPANFNQNEAFSATSPPELLNSRGLTAFSHSSSNGTHNELSKANGVVPGSHLGPSERTEIKKVLSGSVDFSVSDSEPAGCNGGGSEVLTNGFATFDVQGSPSSQDSVHSCKKATSTEDTGSVPAEDDFADFAAFSNAEGHGSQTANEDSDNPPGGSLLAEAACHEEHCDVEQDNTSEDRDTNRTGPDTCGSGLAEGPDGSCNTDRGPHSDSGPAEGPDGSCNTDRGPHSDSGPAEAPDGSCNTDRGPHSDSGPAEGPDGSCNTDREPHSDSGPAEGPDGSCNTDRGPHSDSGPAEAPDGSCNTDREPHSDSGPAEGPDGSCNTDREPHSDSEQRDVAFAQEASEAVCTNRPLTLNGVDVADGDDSTDGGSEDDLSPDAEEGQSDGKGSGNETETSLGRPLSTEALEEFGDISTTGSVPSPPLQGETAATPAHYSQLAEDDDEDYGDFGDAGSFSGQGFADFEQLDVQQEPSRTESPAPAQEATNTEEVEEEVEEDDFGDFNSPKFHASGTVGEEDGGKFEDFPVSNSFGNFSSAADGEADTGWSAFGDQQQQQQVEEEESWAAFSEEPSIAPPAESRTEEEEEEEEWHESEVPAVSEETSSTDRQALCIRLEKLFQGSFPQAAAPPVEDQVMSLKNLLEPEENHQPGGEEKEKRSPCSRSVQGGVWSQLQDIHESFGLRYQWGGSYCNKALLCCLGIDTRNILFTGQKKQPVIVPMYAASLGMLEPTKEPVKPVSAAEMITSIAQTPPPAPETKTSCPADSAPQEALPPVQFDWSSSGLTNPLDASGGSSLLNLDFFGPVEDSGSSSSPSIPGVDPELYELTTAKLDSSGPGSRVADAFARLMSTMEKTSTSTRKPRKEENLSDEASKVISLLPDLSFMQAKVLMFPATLTPLGCQATTD
ncbi:LOW QUALITY PROTEIN: aftiphilin-like [Gymnodraco acuticeps]|uniref:LOW QUALITY PROTEIN: aftiphilin-like n=1 Tax=Gymnodraco acuticeps TaxID=8218 RepID=A0A6P8SWY4_GYMAC|nr:LOW QUALITY PROTEIN: aftiphilin-like [Gymnodraco acuticeps]